MFKSLSCIRLLGQVLSPGGFACHMPQQKTQTKSMRRLPWLWYVNTSLNHDVLYNVLCAVDPSVKSWNSALPQS